MSADDVPDRGDDTRPTEGDADDGSGRYAFWADAAADRIEAREPDEPIVVKGGVSPSGVPHVGHANEILRGYYVAAVLRDRGHEVRQVFTSDDRDPLRAVPRTLMDLDGTLVGLDAVDASALGRNLGKPLTDVPDPFGCCDSFGDHQTELLRRAADLLAVPVEFVSMTDRYETGEMDDEIGTVLSRLDVARDIIASYQDTAGDEYAPFRPICAECGTYTRTVTAVDVEAGTVEYVCDGLRAGDRDIEGCGHEGTATVREGKLAWRFEWPAQWADLAVDFEPFGKDHAEGSWPSGKEIARRVFDADPPEPLVYEGFTVDGEALSSSGGTVLTVDEVLDLVDPAVLRYFFVRNPNKQRDFDTVGIDGLVERFDRFENQYFGRADGTDRELALAERAYPFVVETVDPDRFRLPYTFAAVLGMTDDPAVREDIAGKEGHVPDDAPEWAIEAAFERVDRARTWAARTGNEYDYELKRSAMPDVEFAPAVEAALDDVAAVVADGADGEAIQAEIYEAADRHGIDAADLFAAGYRLFFDDEQGPRLGPFLAKLNREFVAERLRRER
ncbi:lysine--tRNA ligase [Halobacteriales archaeon SW_7_68_16]|nr:MAG: lysine--tRNA ligase [Halobacteriales archaeon SW_7_68_16]